MKNINQQQDLIIIGGGIMGLMTAYFASAFVKNITILEKRTIGSDNKEAASFSKTRSIRTDYLDPVYAQLAYETQSLWLELQKKSSQQFFINCGLLNIAKKSITPDLDKTHAEKSYQIANDLKYAPEKLSEKDLQKRFPQFRADIGRLDTKGGFFYLPAITTLLLKLLKEKNVTIKENCTVTAIKESKNKVTISIIDEIVTTETLVITAGKGTNPILSTIENNKLTFPITYLQPQQKKYFYPPKDIFEMFLPENFPVFAYLDVGIYGHPIFDKKKGAVKISYYTKNEKITSIDEFVKKCMPILQNVRSEEYSDSDMCSYDFTPDDNFIIGKLPGFSRIVVGTGWNGTGYKFSPLIGKILSQLVLQNGTVYDIKKFSPERFIKI